MKKIIEFNSRKKLRNRQKKKEKQLGIQFTVSS